MLSLWSRRRPKTRRASIPADRGGLQRLLRGWPWKYPCLTLSISVVNLGDFECWPLRSPIVDFYRGVDESQRCGRPSTKNAGIRIWPWGGRCWPWTSRRWRSPRCMRSICPAMLLRPPPLTTTTTVVNQIWPTPEEIIRKMTAVGPTSPRARDSSANVSYVLITRSVACCVLGCRRAVNGF